ncbi:MAG TPA: hypothetical protein PK228_08580, partial [Saprospiraceae bacterium]|nr:hypothetical protein [Saprospiraceae bacterium]
TAGTITDTGSEAVETVQANNVADGFALLQKCREASSIDAFISDFFQDISEVISPQDKARLVRQLTELEDTLDAISDLVLSESVFQVAKGNIPRAGAVQQAFSKGEYIPEPEIVQTPRSGHALTHRVGLLLDAASVEGETAGFSPRAKAQPVLNRWLGEQAGELARFKCVVRYKTSAAPDTSRQQTISLQQSGLDPIDMVFMFSKPFYEPASEWSKHILRILLTILPAGTTLTEYSIQYDDTGGENGAISFTAIAPFFQGLYKIITQARHLQPEHFIHPAALTDAGAQSYSTDLTELAARLSVLEQEMNEAKSMLTGAMDILQTDLDSLNDDPLLVIDASHIQAVVAALLKWAFLGLPEAAPDPLLLTDARSAKLLMEQAGMVVELLNKRIQNFVAEKNKINGNLSLATQVASYQQLGKIVFGEDFIILPRFHLANIEEVRSALEDSPAIIPNNDPMVMVMERWLDGVSRVREKVGNMESVILMRELLGTDGTRGPAVKPLQLPYRENDHWVGDELPANYFEEHDKAPATPMAKNKMSLVLMFDQSEGKISASQDGEQGNGVVFLAGLLIDEWNEVIPAKEEMSGIAFHFDQPNAQAPQSVLLAMPPFTNSTTWSIDYVLNTILYAFELAKIRAVEQEDLNDGLNYILNQNQSEEYYTAGNFYTTNVLPGVVSRVVDFAKEKDISVDFNINNIGRSTKEEDLPKFDFITAPSGDDTA